MEIEGQLKQALMEILVMRIALRAISLALSNEQRAKALAISSAEFAHADMKAMLAEGGQAGGTAELEVRRMLDRLFR